MCACSVIRPFASDSPSSSSKPSPQSSSSQHRPYDSQMYPSPQQKVRGAGTSSVWPTETPSRMSPVKFTSSSSSSSSGSPYCGRSPARTPPPPYLAPHPLPTSSPRALSPSPTRSSPTSSRSLSPPTLYRSPDVEETLPSFVETPAPRSSRRSSPPLSAFPSYPPSRFSLPMTAGSQAKSTPALPVIRPPPPPSKATAKSSKSKQSVITETVSKIVVSN